MIGARHIVQRKFIRSTDQGAVANRAKFNSDEPDCMYGMELLKHGSVDRLLKKVSSQSLKLRDDELWMIFHCRELPRPANGDLSRESIIYDTDTTLQSSGPVWRCPTPERGLVASIP